MLLLLSMKGQKKKIITDEKLKLLSAAALIKKAQKGITTEELYREATKKFNTLVEILNNKYSDSSLFGALTFSPDELKINVLLIFDRLISNRDANPYLTLCIPINASLEEIKRRRKKLLQIFHPDRIRENSASEINTKRINDAYDKILAKPHNFNKLQQKTTGVETNKKSTAKRKILRSPGSSHTMKWFHSIHPVFHSCFILIRANSVISFAVFLIIWALALIFLFLK
jgi:hypothetical protein